MTTIPLRQLVLYKHGIGYFTRRGRVEGRELVLPFRHDEVDDALKSLAAITLDGGQVTGITYRTPEDTSTPDGGPALTLAPGHALFDLLSSLRGVAVSAHLGGPSPLEGRVIGIERHPQGREHGATLLLQTTGGTLEQVATDRIVSLRLVNADAQKDLNTYLDAGLLRHTERTVHVVLNEEGREVQVSYTVPSATWRVSYRLVGERSGEGRQALLQGWGIFDNRLDEDLEGVEVALVAGQPVSFRYDLTSSVIPKRRFVRDEARVAAGPIEFDGDMMMNEFDAVYSSEVSMLADDAPGYRAQAMPALRMPAVARMADISDSTVAPAAGKDLDELFEYRIGEVSVRRGESAMVPIAQHRGDYRKELLYNAEKGDEHPVATFRLQNDTGLTLERGPITIVEDGQYRGEVILPYTRAGAEIVLPYAVELGVKVLAVEKSRTQVTGIEFEGAYLQIQEHLHHDTTYSLSNRTQEEQIVTVEQTRRHGAELDGTRAPDAESAEWRRWKVTCPPGTTTCFDVKERILVQRHEYLRDQNLSALSQYLKYRFLDDTTRQGIQSVMRLRGEIGELEAAGARLEDERRPLAERQERLRRNLSIVAGNDEEATIRRRSAEEFSRTQDREAAIDTELARITGEKAAREADLARALGELK